MTPRFSDSFGRFQGFRQLTDIMPARSDHNDPAAIAHGELDEAVEERFERMRGTTN
jgi:hypothetical protein